MQKIKIPEDCSSDCFDSITYSMLKYYAFDYEAYNVKYYYTDYFCPLNNCIIRGNINNDTLKKIYNINVISQNRDELNMTDLIHKVPIGVFIDSYYCYWTPFYNKVHFSHCLLIVDVDYQNKKYLCFDVHFNKVGYVEVDIDIILAHYTSCFIYDLKNANQIDVKSILGTIHDSLNNYNDNIADKTSEMFDYFITTDRLVLFPDNLETSITLVNLMWISEDKKHFPIALRYIEKRLGVDVFSSVCELLMESGKMFSVLISFLIKYAMTGVLKEEKLMTIINQIFVTDDLIHKQIKISLQELNFK